MEYKDYYRTLGVARDATDEEIQRAYRKLARTYHPDISEEADAETRFKEIGEAYEVLKDRGKRAAYDRVGSGWRPGTDNQHPQGWESGSGFAGGAFAEADHSGFSDIFDLLFGRNEGRSGWRKAPSSFRGADVHARLEIDLEDSIHGAVRTLTLEEPIVDPRGRRVMSERRIKVRIPKGVRPGQRIRLAGQGRPAVGRGQRGDLYLEVEFRPHPVYAVSGKDLYMELQIAPWDAARGAQLTIPTPSGSVDLKIPPGSKDGRRLRLRGRGLPSKHPGDLFVVLRVASPAADSADTRATYPDMAARYRFDGRRHTGV